MIFFFDIYFSGGVLRWDDLSDLDRKVLLEVDQGPQRMAKGSAVSLTIYYCFLFTVGVPGNLLTCLIICTNSYMRTPSNFFLVSLALTDLLSIIYGEINLKSRNTYFSKPNEASLRLSEGPSDRHKTKETPPLWMVKKFQQPMKNFSLTCFWRQQSEPNKSYHMRKGIRPCQKMFFLCVCSLFLLFNIPCAFWKMWYARGRGLPILGYRISMTQSYAASISVIPMEILLIWRAYPWPFGDFGCKMLTVASELVTHVSIFTMIVFTFER